MCQRTSTTLRSTIKYTLWLAASKFALIFCFSPFRSYVVACWIFTSFSVHDLPASGFIIEDHKYSFASTGGSLTKLAYYSTVQHKVAKVRSFDHTTKVSQLII